MWWEEVIHDYEMDLTTPRKFNSMKSVKSADECMRIGLDVLDVLWEDSEEELVFCLMDCFDYESVIAREVEEGAALPWGA